MTGIQNWVMNRLLVFIIIALITLLIGQKTALAGQGSLPSGSSEIQVN